MAEKATQEEIERMIIYSMHIILYTNDMAINAIKGMDKFMKGRDKQSLKIYHALRKRTKAYRQMLLKALGPKDDWFYADFSLVFDESIGKEVKGLKRSAEWIFRCNGYSDTEFLSQLETAYALTALATSTATAFMENISQYSDRTVIPNYNIKDIHRVMNNFYNWCMFMTKKDKDIDLSAKKSVSKYFERIKAVLMSQEVFKEAYKFASEEEKKSRELNNK